MDEKDLKDPRFQQATLGGGCFWCLEAVFAEIRGVRRVLSGYTGGAVVNPSYRQVCNGDTGHAEVIQVEFDPKEVSFADLLDVFFALHDPTTLNRQGNDVGTQYRSVIFTHSQEQAEVARQKIAEFTEVYPRPIVTQVQPLDTFYQAEDYHQNYYRDNPTQGYCQVVIGPKLGKFRAKFVELARHDSLPQASAEHNTKRRQPQTPTTLADAIDICFRDAHILVVNKPAGLTTVRHRDEVDARSQKFMPPSLVDLLPKLLGWAGTGHPRIRAVHRLDKETSGLVVLALTPDAERHLGNQFRDHSTGREYLALVRGAGKTETVESQLVPDRGDGRRGSGSAGQRAVTHVEVLESLGAFSLVRCTLETGRTHQVRIHLGERGTPLCGERIYDRPLHGRPAPDGSNATRPLLHAAKLALDHPKTGKRLEWSVALPEDMQSLVKKLRRSTN